MCVCVCVCACVRACVCVFENTVPRDTVPLAGSTEHFVTAMRR